MNQEDLLNSILYLHPTAKFAIYELTDLNIDNSDQQYTLDGFRVSWSSTNTSNCPTQADLDQLNQANVKAQAVIRNKQQYADSLSKDIQLKAAFLVMQQQNPNLTFVDFVDSVRASNA